MASPLQSLPMELLEAVLRNLEPAQLLSVRLACKELNMRSLHLVGTAQFSTVSTDLSLSSLKQLDALATESPFGPYVRNLHIATRGDMDEGEVLGNGFEWPRHMALRQSTVRQRQGDDSNYRPNALEIQFCPGIIKLRHLLASQLTNCRSFSLEMHYLSLQYCRLHGLQDCFITALDVVAIMLSLCTGPRCLLTTSIVLKLNSCTYEHLIEDQDYRELDSFCTDLPNLKSLVFYENIQQDARKFWLKCIASILLKATMLEDLELGSFRKYPRPAWPTRDYQSISLCVPSLVNLKLTCMEMLVNTLQCLLYFSQRTLKALYLSQIHIPGFRVDPHVWPKQLRNMGQTLSALERITIDKLSTGSVKPQRLDFGEVSERLATEVGILTVQAEESFFDVTGILGATFKGPGMDCGLELLARALERGLQT